MAIHLDSSTVSLDKPILWAYRCLALLWIAKGYLGWFYLMTATTSSLHLVGHDGWVDLISMVVIPILDIIAGVSLWISWRWGSGVWAVIAFGYVCLEITEHTHVHSFMPVIVIGLLLAIHCARIFLIRGKAEKQIKIV